MPDSVSTSPDGIQLRLLAHVFVIKMVGTLALLAGPMLLFCEEHHARYVGIRPAPLFVMQLLGMAYLALVIGYFEGWRQLRQGHFPAAIVAMGVVSNVGAVLVVAHAVVTGRLDLHTLKLLGLVAIGFPAAISVSLIACLLLRWAGARVATQPAA